MATRVSRDGSRVSVSNRYTLHGYVLDSQRRFRDKEMRSQQLTVPDERTYSNYSLLTLLWDASARASLRIPLDENNGESPGPRDMYTTLKRFCDYSNIIGSCRSKYIFVLHLYLTQAIAEAQEYNFIRQIGSRTKKKTRGQSNLTKSASRGAHSPVKGHPRGSKVVSLNSWGRVSY